MYKFDVRVLTISLINEVLSKMEETDICSICLLNTVGYGEETSFKSSLVSV